MTTTSAAVTVTRISLTISLIVWIAKVLTVTVLSATSASKYYFILLDFCYVDASSYLLLARPYLTFFLSCSFLVRMT